MFYLVGIHWIALLSDGRDHGAVAQVPGVAAGRRSTWRCFAGLDARCSPAALARRAGVPLAVTFPLALLVVEELRASGELGFPWFQPGYTQHAYVPVLQLASLGGVSAGHAVAAGRSTCCVWRALRRGTRAAARRASARRCCSALPWAWGARVLRRRAARRTGPAVALVQGNIPGEIKWSGKHQTRDPRHVPALSRAARADTARPALVIWPETATGSYLRQQLEQALAVAGLRRAHRRAGVQRASPTTESARDGATAQLQRGRRCSCPTARSAPVYAKRHLVPFGERMPFQWLVPALGQRRPRPGGVDARHRAGAVPERGRAVRRAGLLRVDLPRSRARRRARAARRWLVNITNDEWFGNSAALYQHAAMAVFRAVENHVPLARCANTGLTMLVDALRPRRRRGCRCGRRRRAGRALLEPRGPADAVHARRRLARRARARWSSLIGARRARAWRARVDTAARAPPSMRRSGRFRGRASERGAATSSVPAGDLR